MKNAVAAMMSSKKWFFMLAGTLVLVFLLVAGFNAIVDPFGVFGDPLLGWYSSNFTNNPRAAKIAYIDKHHDQYDSYLIGGSSTSSLPVEKLNEYMDARFFNMFMYGADLYDVEQTAKYLIQNYEVKNLVINLGMQNAVNYNYESHPLTDSLHAKTDGSSLVRFYSRFLFANPQYAVSKLKNHAADTYLPQPFDVFHTGSGAYDKSVRDVEPIGDLNEYLAKYPVFADYPERNYGLPNTESLLAGLSEIKQLCDENGINLLVIFSPMYTGNMAYFKQADLASLWTGLAEITDFWDFSMSAASDDPRYFYDATHFRNNVGTMVLAKIFEDDSVWMPTDFGVYVTPENAAHRAVELKERLTNYQLTQPDEPTTPIESTNVPILMYHHLSEDVTSSAVMTPDTFELHIAALKEAGYTGISLKELSDYVTSGADLPEKPVVITFDDGYLSNYEVAYPILQKYGMKATIFVIGSSVGKSTYKDTGHAIIPHFDYEQSREMIASGLIEIQSHFYDMHQSKDLEIGAARSTIAQLEGESDEDYIAALRDDITQSITDLEQGTGQECFAFSYPLGVYTTLSKVILKEEGAKVTLTTTAKPNTVVRGLPQSLLDLGRFGITNDISPEALLDLLQ